MSKIESMSKWRGKKKVKRRKECTNETDLDISGEKKLPKGER